MRNPRVVFFLLLIVIAGSIYWAQVQSPQVRNVGIDSNERSDAIPVSQEGRQGVRLNFSGGEQRTFKKPARDLFDMLYPAPPVKAAPKVAPKPVPVVQEPVRPVVPPPPPVPIRSTTRRMPGFQVVGFLEKGSELTAFVMLQGDIHLLKQGQRFAEEYQVASLTPEAIRIVRLSGDGEVSLPLQDNPGGARVPGARPSGAVPGGLPAGHPSLNQTN